MPAQEKNHSKLTSPSSVCPLARPKLHSASGIWNPRGIFSTFRGETQILLVRKCGLQAAFRTKLAGANARALSIDRE